MTSPILLGSQADGGALSRLRVTKSNASIPNGANTKFTFDTVNVDDLEIAALPTDTITLTAGMWHLIGRTSFAANSTGVRSTFLNGTDGTTSTQTASAGAGDPTIHSLGGYLNVEDDTTAEVSLSVYQTSGGALTVSGSLHAVRVGDPI